MCASVAELRAELSPARWRDWISRFIDRVEKGWTIPALLGGFVGIWLVYLMIAYVGGDLHSDVLETWTLGRSFEWGYSKHPPLMGWVARAWTSIFPLTNWSFQLLSLVNAALGLWVIDLITRRFVSGDKRLFVTLLLMLLPIYQLHAQRFNANAVLLPAWPLATYCFLHSFETRQTRWAIAAGFAGALAMLGKYYSVFLLISFALAAAAHPRRRAYFTSRAPWISTGIGLAALAPHIYWLATTGAKPFAYALERHTGKSFLPSLAEAALFILGLAALLAVPAAICIFVSGKRLETIHREVRRGISAMDDRLWLLLCIGVGAIALPALVAAGCGTDMPPLWGVQSLFLFVIVMVCKLREPISRDHSVNLAGAVIGTALFATFIVAPIHAIYRNEHPLHEGRNFYRQASDELTRLWHEQSDTPLASVGGDDGLAFAVAFYAADHPIYDDRVVYPFNERLPADVSLEAGWAALCFAEDLGCIQSTERTAARSQHVVRSDFVLQSTLLGQPGAIQRFTALIVPPASEEVVPPAQNPGVAEDFSAVRRTRQRLN
jgi:hypothetical protein